MEIDLLCKLSWQYRKKAVETIGILIGRKLSRNNFWKVEDGEKMQKNTGKCLSKVQVVV